MKAPVLLGTLGVALAITALPSTAETVTITAGTTVSVELAQNVHSSFNTQGEIVYLRVVDELSVDGQTVIPQGALVEAEVGSAEGTGMIGKSGSIAFRPLRIAAADGQWLPLDPTNFGDAGEGAGVGMILAIGVFARGKPGFVARGTNYRVTIRRDTEVETDLLRPAREVAPADVMFTGSVKSLRTVNMTRNKSGGDIEIELSLPSETMSLVPTGATDIEIISLIDYVPETPVQSIAVEIDSRRNLLAASFDWWDIIKYAQPGSTALTVQFELSDGRLARADLTMQSSWKTD
jgi:hypothetical protein